jgi:enterochelin esterase-like enzyme
VLTTGLLVSWRYFTFSKWQELLPFVPMRLDMVATAETLVVLTLLGMSLGAAGSLMSVRKHLKLAMAPE